MHNVEIAGIMFTYAELLVQYYTNLPTVMEALNYGCDRISNVYKTSP